MQTNNPAFSENFARNFDYAGGRSSTMTVQGTSLKAMVLLAIVMATATYSWVKTEEGTLTGGFLMGSAIGGFVFALITMFKPTLAPWTAPVYSALQGIFLGAISRLAEQRFPGIAIQAVGLTGGVTFLMLFLYVTGIIKVTGQLVSAIVAATGAIALLYLATIVLSMFHIQIPFIFEAGPIGIGFSLFVVGLAAFNLLLDFDFIDRGSQAGLSKSMEWYGAFALMVTLIWLYLEVLRLLQKVNSRR
ncbi:Bax inhibitor-1/YccA family protein [Tundrisphaera lichenicola]|uniref:Bax inhibitor-1/YccA family protein n=1 Tax=Tundrisphaera lichenicola TaxID=2029860 RepID=UPI003EC07FAF